MENPEILIFIETDAYDTDRLGKVAPGETVHYLLNKHGWRAWGRKIK
ncbi:MAG: hypothetical protein GY757_39515 [bacterium]|nr:hypothetical protein [bacterium]